MKLPNWGELWALHEGPRTEALIALCGLWNRWRYPFTPNRDRQQSRRMAREFISQIRLIDDAQGLTREERGDAICHHSHRTERVIRTPNGMLMAVMECSQCGDQQVGKHHYSWTRGGAR